MKPLISLAGIWNESLIVPDRAPQSRDYLWASALSKPPVDTWLAMRGTPPTNQPNERARRKFASGELFEHFVSMIMMRSGVMCEKQDEIWTHYDIDVKGKGDFILTGSFDFAKAQHDIKQMMLPSGLEYRFLAMCEKMREKYEGIEFEPTVFEIKSVSERVMERIEKADKPYDTHILQTVHYKLGRGLNDAVVAVICRDDLRLFEYHTTEEDEKDYVKKVNALAVVLKSDDRPPLEPKLYFDEVLGKFTKNIMVEWSNYLTLLYGYERPDQFSDEVKPVVERFNRVLSRVKMIQDGKTTPTGKPIVLTDKNKVVLDEMVAAGYDPYAIAKKADVEEGEEA